jgi:hypothetical protein
MDRVEVTGGYRVETYRVETRQRAGRQAFDQRVCLWHHDRWIGLRLQGVIEWKHIEWKQDKEQAGRHSTSAFAFGTMIDG